MGSKKRKRLEAAVGAIQQRWGQRVLRRGLRPAQVARIPTGFAALDAVLDGCGGIPLGRLSEILGAPTSGMTTLALKIIVEAQRQDHLTAYVDLNRTFDPDYAARCEVDLKRLILVRPGDGLEALQLSHSLLAGGSVGLLVFDNITALNQYPDQAAALAANLSQLPATLTRATSAFIGLTPLQFGKALSTANYLPGFALPHLASLRLELKKECWLYRGRDVRGYQAKVVVLKNKLGRAGQQANLVITFNGTVRGDST